jgi:periplasmic copper chaperone A
MRGMRSWRGRVLASVPVVLVIVLCAACAPGGVAGIGGATAGPKIRVENVWSRPASAVVAMAGSGATGAITGTMAMATANHPPRGNGVVYFTVVNDGDAADRLLRVQTDVAEVVELHLSQLDNGVMKMEPVASGIDVPAHGKVELKPGSYHVMLIGLVHDLKPDDRFPVVVELEKSGPVKVEAVVRQP